MAPTIRVFWDALTKRSFDGLLRRYNYYDLRLQDNGVNGDDDGDIGFASGLYVFLRYHFVPDVVAPLTACLVAAWLAYRFVAAPAYRRQFPFTPAQLHYEALSALRRDTAASGKKKRRPGGVDTCLRLLRQAAFGSGNSGMDKDKNKPSCRYLPAAQSLAALYLYRLGRPRDALDVLELSGTTDSARTTGDDACASERLVRDAKAALQGDAAMVLSVLGEEEFLSLRFVSVSSIRYRRTMMSKTKQA